jgi:osmotically-inducible protein OsmY
MKTDIELQSDVLEELRWEPAVAFAGITVLAKDGVVTLTGTVPFFAEKLAAERATRRVKGVKAIAEELSVRVLEYHNHKDTDIAESVANALKWHVWVPDSVQATVEKGWVSLNGQVKWQYQRNAAEDAVRYLSGVVGISNKIAVNPGIEPSDVRTAIEGALKRDAQIDSDNIKVSTAGGKVTLTGKIHSWNQRDDAGWAAWSAPGVNEVQNDLAVSY